MKPAQFSYYRAGDVAEALDLLAGFDGEAKLLAGGQSLVAMMNFRLARPPALIDITRIAGLNYLRAGPDGLRIGALTPHRAVETTRDPAVLDGFGVLPRSAHWIGHYPIRVRGTFGGSIAHADPSADMPAVMLALNAEIHLKGPNGRRVVKAADFFKDLFTVDMAADEIIVSVQFAPVRTAAYAKLYQRASHFAIVGVAAAFEVSGGTIVSARIGLTGAASHARRLINVEQALAGQPLSNEVIGRAAQVAGLDLQDVNSDIHASADYRRAMIPVFTRRALTAAMARA